MKKLDKRTIRSIIDNLGGLSLKDSREYSQEAKEFFQNRYYEIIRLLPKFRNNNIGLEIGLAGGVLAFAVKDIFELDRLYALEHPHTSDLYTKLFLDKLKLNKIFLKPVDLRNGSLPWPNGFFDFVLFCDVLEHLVPADIPLILKEIYRILKKGGYLVIVTPNVASLLKRINLVRGKNPIELDLILHEGATNGHIREYTMDELEIIAKTAKFKTVRKQFFMIDAKRSIFTKLENVLSKVYPSFANSLAMSFKK